MNIFILCAYQKVGHIGQGKVEKLEYTLSEDSDHHKRLPSLLSFASAKSDHFSRSQYN